MVPDVYEHVIYQILNTPMNDYPFEHLYVKDVFPKDFYQQILVNLPTTEEYTCIEKLGRVSKGSYLERFLYPLDKEKIENLPQEKKEFWQNFMNMFMGEEFKQVATHLFEDIMQKKFADEPDLKLKWTVDLVRDTINYSIGPHTDSPQKVITFIFYLPEDESHPNIGTSLFAPKDPNYTDSRGYHHDFDLFKMITTMPFMPNTMFGFIRTDTSWHGVAPVKEKVERNSITFQLMRV